MKVDDFRTNTSTLINTWCVDIFGMYRFMVTVRLY